MMKSGEFDVRNCIQNLRSVISKFHSNLIIPSQRHPFISFISTTQNHLILSNA